MNFKSRFKLGLMVAIPGFFLVFLAGVVLSTFKIWYPFLDFINLAGFLYTPASVALTLLFVYGVGLVITTKWVDWLLSRLPIIRRIWSPLKAMADRIAFASQGGYKIVVYRGYDNKTKRIRPGIVLGKTIVEDIDTGEEELFLVVMQPPPNVFDSYLMPSKDTRIVVGDAKSLIIYMFSGGIISPPRIKTRGWTKQELERIPESGQKEAKEGE